MKHDILVRMSQFNTSGEELKGLRKLFTDIKLRKTDERPVICEKSILLYYLNHDTATNTRDDALGGLADRRQFGLSEYGTFCSIGTAALSGSCCHNGHIVVVTSSTSGCLQLR